MLSLNPEVPEVLDGLSESSVWDQVLLSAFRKMKYESMAKAILGALQ